MRIFSKKSQGILANAHPFLVSITSIALIKGPQDFSVLESHRSKEDQEKAFRAGNTKVHFPNSAHNQLPSLAVDLLPYPFKGWNDIAAFKQISVQMFAAAKIVGLEIRWGGDFNRDGDKTKTDAWDLPHYELHPWRNWIGR